VDREAVDGQKNAFAFRIDDGKGVAAADAGTQFAATFLPGFEQAGGPTGLARDAGVVIVQETRRSGHRTGGSGITRSQSAAQVE
jgi:hypothetical protein